MSDLVILQKLDARISFYFGKMEKEWYGLSVRDIPWGSTLEGLNITWVHVSDIGLVGGGKQGSRKENVDVEHEAGEDDEMAALGLPTSFKTSKKRVYPKGRMRQLSVNSRTHPETETCGVDDDCWYQAYDDNYCCYYYYNLSLQKTQWEPPDCEYQPLGSASAKEGSIDPDVTVGMRNVSLDDGFQDASGSGKVEGIEVGEVEPSEYRISESMETSSIETSGMDTGEAPDAEKCGPSKTGGSGCLNGDGKIEPCVDLETPACRKEPSDIEMDGACAGSVGECGPVMDAMNATVNQRKRPLLSHGEAAEVRAKLPRNVFKYWLQRYSLFSRFDDGIQMDTAGWFSATPECVALHQAKRCTCNVIVDAFTGVGGNAIQFAQTCSRVIAIDSSPERIEIARHNAQVYGVESRIDFICGDFFEIGPNLRADVVFISPPWGGPSYRHSESLPINESSEIGQMVLKSATISRDIVGRGAGPGCKELGKRGLVLFLPKNSELGSMHDLRSSEENLEVEAVAVNENLKAVTTYIGSF
ncbi:hypothetical protein BSKO_02981 [Bryopsis sp. KO-2023]|nr:hypothetical protein BSKO_02981 [Bryopsis sp. KO-2023]